MTAGKGIVHSEMPLLKPGEVAHGLQLWLNLRAKDKMCEPRYQELPSAKVPKVKKDGIEAHVIAGTALGTTSPVYTLTACHYIHFHMDAHKTLHQPITPGWNSFLYSIDGKISVGTPNPKKLIDAHNTITLTNEAGQDGITVTTFDEPANFVFLAGEVIGEPIMQHGPFVLTSRDGIMSTFRDFQEGKNGFEKAPGWRSDIGRVITDHM
jgi:redox-sensitive bicupin YhaK (pirin superfamily)